MTLEKNLELEVDHVYVWIYRGLRRRIQLSEPVVDRNAAGLVVQSNQQTVVVVVVPQWRGVEF